MKAIKNVVVDLIKLEVSAPNADLIFDRMNEEYKDIKSMLITPVKSEIDRFDVIIQLYSTNKVEKVVKRRFWSLIRKSKQSPIMGI